MMSLKNEVLALLAEVSSENELEGLRNSYLGKKGRVNQLTKEISNLAKEEKPDAGRLLNELKKIIEEEFERRANSFGLEKEGEGRIDVTLAGEKPKMGHLHLVSVAMNEIDEIFKELGFTRTTYPEIEYDWYAFEGLNMPKDHPARDEWETFFIEAKENKRFGKVVLTPHTSNGQIREMERLGKPPIRMINMSKCYRRQSDVSHIQMFHQFEGLVVDKGISIVHLKGTIDYFVKRFFGEERRARIRPFHFQFTEPSFEVDLSCSVCNGKGCKLCKEGWLELGGAGMVHPNVLRAGKIDPNKYTGFAFGWGVERTYMMKEGLMVDDLRILYRNDLRFLNQF